MSAESGIITPNQQEERRRRKMVADDKGEERAAAVQCRLQGKSNLVWFCLRLVMISAFPQQFHRFVQQQPSLFHLDFPPEIFSRSQFSP